MTKVIADEATATAIRNGGSAKVSSNAALNRSSILSSLRATTISGAAAVAAGLSFTLLLMASKVSRNS